MTKFFLFSYEDYDACGGFNDLVGIFDTLDKAVCHIRDHLSGFSASKNIVLWSVGNNGEKLLLYTFRVVNHNGNIQCVFGDYDQRIIYALGKEYGPPWRYDSSLPMKEYRLDL